MTGLAARSPRPSFSGVTVRAAAYSLFVASSLLCLHTASATSPQRLFSNLSVINGTIEDSLINATHGHIFRGLCTANAPTPSYPCDDSERRLPDCCFYDCAEFCKTADGSEVEELQLVEIFNTKLKREQFGCHKAEGKTHGYLLVSTCSEDYTYASRKCPGKEDASLLSISRVTVTSLTSGVSYRNIYCAVCNNETVADLRAWPVQVVCDTEGDYEAALVELRSASRDSIAMKKLNCSAEMRLPVDTEKVATPVSRACTGRVVTCCPMNPSKTRHMPGGGSSMSIENHIPPISILMDFGSSSHVRIVRMEKVVAEERVTCPAGRVFDPFGSRCRRLFCAEGYVLSSGRCVFVPIQRSVKELDVKIHVTRSIHANNTGPDCLQRRDETSFCLAGFLGIEADDVTLDSEKHPETDMKTNDCSNTFHLDSGTETFQTLWRHLLLSWSPTANLQMCHSSGVWFVRVERHTNDTNTPCKLSLLNATEYSTERYNSTGIVDTFRDPYSSEQVAIHATFNTEGVNLSSMVELEICEEVSFTCPLLYLNKTLFRETDDTSGSVVYIPTGRVYTDLEYRDTGDGRLQLCSFLESNGTRNVTTTVRFFQYSETQVVLSLVGNVVSMVAGGATFLTYFVFDVLRNHATCCIMNLVASLFMAQLLLLLTGTATANPAGCSMVAALSHFFWLVNVFWTGILAYDLNRTFAGNSCAVSRGCNAGHHHRPRLRTYALLTWGGSFLIVVTCLVVYLCDCTELPIWYGNSEVCWVGDGQSALVVFAAPVACTLLSNILFFGRTVWTIHKTNKETRHNIQKNVTKMRMMREELIIYVKISTLMGFTWIFGFAAALSDLGGIWYVFIALNSFQGVLVFFSFTCNQKVRILWLEAFCGESLRKRSYSHGIASSSASATRATRV